MKALSREDEMDLFLAIGTLSDTEQQVMTRALSKVKTEVYKYQPTPKGQKRRRKPDDISKSDIFNEFLPKLKANLNKYEENEITRDHIKLNFQPLLDYSNLSDDQLKAQYKELDMADQNIKKLSLLMVFYKGCLFYELKWGQRKINWEKFCAEDLDVSVTMANRYIAFMQWCRKYPRLVISGMNFTTLEANREMLDKHLKRDLDLRAKLEAPLREMVIDGSKVIIRADQLPTHVDEETQMTEDPQDIHAAYEVRDRCVDKMMAQEDFDDSLLDSDQDG